MGVIVPLLPGTPQNCLRRFCGEPHSGLLPHCVTARARLRGGVNFAAHLSHGCSFSPSEYAFGGDPLESSVLYHGSIAYPPSCGFPQKPFPPAGSHGFRGHLRRSGMRASEDGASTAPPCYAACNAPASRREWRIAGARFVSPRHSYGRRRLSRGGDAACESLAGRLHSELDNVGSSGVTFGVYVIPSPKQSY